MEQTFKVKELFESNTNEFKPKIGDKVESENSKNNKKAYSDAKKEIKTSEYKPKKEKKSEFDLNKTTLDYTFDNEPGDEYKKRVHVQAQGYTNVDEKNNDIEKCGEFKDDFYQTAKSAANKTQKAEKDFKKTGLQAKEMPDEYFEKENMFENKNIKTVRFKKAEFLTEEHMISKIPNEMKIDGSVFKMVDKNENTYIVEWKKNIYKNTSDAVIIEHKNDKLVNENIERMKQLYGFKHSDKYAKTTGKERVNESNENFDSTLEKMRKIIK